MKAEELMIGDLVKFPYGIDKVCDLPYVEGKGICASFAASATLFPVPVEALEPIPLTPEILEKNGFRWTGSGDSTGMLSTPWDFDGIRYNIYVGLKKKTIEVHSAHPELRTESWRKVNKVSLEVCGFFVHELQHALRLCGINLEIKI